jgi:hypothetical protein
VRRLVCHQQRGDSVKRNAERDQDEEAPCCCDRFQPAGYIDRLHLRDSRAGGLATLLLRAPHRLSLRLLHYSLRKDDVACRFIGALMMMRRKTVGMWVDFFR